MLSWSWQIFKAFVQCTLKKSCCKPIPLPFVASLGFSEDFGGFFGLFLFVCLFLVFFKKCVYGMDTFWYVCEMTA